MTQYVESPAGDRLEVFSDDDLAALFPDLPTSALSLMTSWQPRVDSPRGPALSSLWVDGPVVNDSGRAGLVLRDRAARFGLDPGRDPASVVTAFRQGAFDLFVERRTRGKRTFVIRLIAVAERWLPYLTKIETATVPTRDAVSSGSDDVASPAAPEPAPAVEAVPGGDVSTNGHSDGSAAVAVPGPAPVEFELTNAVATALLTQVVEIISTGKSAAPELGRLRLDVEALEERLGVQVGYVDKLRRDLREAGDEIAALKVERDGLRQRLRAAEHNLRVATGADAARIIDAEVQRQVDRIMRERPAGAGSKALAS